MLYNAVCFALFPAWVINSAATFSFLSNSTATWWSCDEMCGIVKA